MAHAQYLRPKMSAKLQAQIKTILARLHSSGITMFNESHVDYALRSKASQGNMDEAFRLLLLFEDTYEGLVRPYNPNTKLLGAENRSGVTCYLDALLFAMFARLDSFEAMLYNSFDDGPRKKLAGLLRLWVNLLRDGKLITTDIVCYPSTRSSRICLPCADQISARSPFGVRLGLCGQTRATGYVRGV